MLLASKMSNNEFNILWLFIVVLDLYLLNRDKDWLMGTNGFLKGVKLLEARSNYTITSPLSTFPTILAAI